MMLTALARHAITSILSIEPARMSGGDAVAVTRWFGWRQSRLPITEVTMKRVLRKGQSERRAEKPHLHE